MVIVLLAAGCATDEGATGVVATPAATLSATQAATPTPTPVPEAEATATASTPDATVPTLSLTQVVDGLAAPIHATGAGDGSGRIFVVEKAGRIRIVSQGALREQPFLDISSLVGSSSSEQGLLSVAFHPDYRNNGRFFVDYTDLDGNTVIASYRTGKDPNQADAGSATTLLHIDQPAANHNGGQLAFGPDGYLYIGMGDGGAGGDPWGNGQNRDALLGKLLRIDVNSGTPYAIPSDNPFATTTGAKPEVWAYGLRNPWRFSFDRETGDLFIGDVGQNAREEVNFQPAKSPGGENYGWNRMEGNQCYQPRSGCDQEGLTLPIIDYGRDDGCSVISGFRYRGTANPSLTGIYIFGDYCGGHIWGLKQDANGAWQRFSLLDNVSGLSSFGQDDEGELYVTSLDAGTLSRLSNP